MEGFWGPVTSTMNWCEENYVLVSWIAEFWNSLSSIFILVVGLIGWRLHRNHDLGMQIAFIALGIIGFGSMAFHGTLRFETQMMDEIPMVWAALCMLYNLATGLIPKRHHSWLATILIVWGLGTTIAMISTRHTIEFQIFATNFLLAEILGFAAVVLHYALNFCAGISALDFCVGFPRWILR